MTCEATPVIETKAVASKKGNTGVSESNAYKKWLSAEDKLIVKMRDSGEQTSEIAVRMKRKEGEVKRWSNLTRIKSFSPTTLPHKSTKIEYIE
ncbi:hypothetical protein [Methanococcoides alaskense]|uniref:Uncharacterized protein n=1 Tax=Methanococcoides alaskense TaxID=325778 RepID=A0AA90Z5Y6_9EURY|nr:hypothetical protein [Methanococcoides alaskense]MDA0525438.1 hypothetical protein [Methanococcoides alaskense]MDR6221629.1 hypothetical protein [Methanococcoides alaskense]